MLCFSKEALSSPLTTLPSQALQTEAVKLFKVQKSTFLLYVEKNSFFDKIFQPCAASFNVILDYK